MIYKQYVKGRGKFTAQNTLGEPIGEDVKNREDNHSIIRELSVSPSVCLFVFPPNPRSRVCFSEQNEGVYCEQSDHGITSEASKCNLSKNKDVFCKRSE